MPQRFRALRIVAVVWKILAWIVLVGSVLGGCGSLALALTASGAAPRSTSAMSGLGMMGGVLGGVVGAVIALFFGVIYFISLYAVAELIDVTLALEENTRLTAERIKDLAKS